MNETLFENSYLPTEERSREVIRRNIRGRIILLSLIYVMLSFRLVRLIVECIWYGIYVEFYLYLLTAAVFVATLFILFQARYFAWRNIRKLRKFYDGELPMQYIDFTEEEIICRFGENLSRTPYRKLDKVVFTKNTLILCSQKVTRIPVTKDGFTKDTYPEFLAFLRTKCPTLKIPE